MAAITNIPNDIQETIQDALDKSVKVSVMRMVRMEVRSEKIENKVLALSNYRLFILTAKVPSKLEFSFNFLEIQTIESKKSNQLTIVVEGKPWMFQSTEPTLADMDLIITHIGVSLAQTFPAVLLDRLIVKIEIQPPDRHRVLTNLIQSSEKKEPSPCGGFSGMYRCMCDFHSLPYREEVAWDIDTIYLSHDSKELRLQDFDHLIGKDLVPIIGALENNDWFLKINASCVRLSGECCNEIIKVIKRNTVIEEVNLSNTGIKMDFVQKFATAIISNSGSQLTSLDLSNNLLDDKAIQHLLGAIKLLPCGLVNLDVSKTGITTRCINRIGEVLGQTPNVQTTLTTLKLNDNGLKGEDFPMLYNFLAQPNVITYLDMSSTDCALDTLCDPLLRGCSNLVSLKASRTVFSHKRSKDVSVPLSWKQLFSSACCLKHLDLSNCKLPPEALKDLLLGLSSNRNVKGIFLDLSSNELGLAGANVLSSCISTLSAVQGLDISNNSFDADMRSLLSEIAKNSSLKYLAIGRNFSNIKPKFMQEVLDALVLMLQEETSALESLSLADSKLKSDATYIINALGSNHSLQEIDLSGNLIGDFGARLIAKALLINTKLSRVVWDKNNVSAQGFEDVADALHRNLTLKEMPYPINDAAAALKLYPERTEAALNKIESFLQRNHSPRRFASDNAYRLQQGFLINSTQQTVDRLVIQVQDTVNALKSLGTSDCSPADMESALRLISDANNSRLVFSGLQDIAMQSQVKGNPVDVQLQEMADKLRKTIEEQMQKTVSDMLKCTLQFCPNILSESTSVKDSCLSKSVLPKQFTQGVLEGASTEIYNLISERNLECAALISDNLVDTVIDSLTACRKTLVGHINLKSHGQEKDTNEAFIDSVGPSSPTYAKTSPKLVDKRKSLLSRKTRPQSTVVLHDHKTAAVCEIDTDKSSLADEELGLKLPPGKVGLSSLQETSSGTNEQVNLTDLPSLSRPLEHITKGRPRREKMHRPTRPILDTGTTDLTEEINNGPRPVLQTQTSLTAEAKEVLKSGREDTTLLAKSDATKPRQEEPTSKTKWFTKKTKEEKAEKEPKKSSFSSGFTSFFKKKEEKRRSSIPEGSEGKVEVVAGSSAPSGSQKDKKSTDGLDAVKEVDLSSDDGGGSSDTTAGPAPEVSRDIMSQPAVPAREKTAILPPPRKPHVRPLLPPPGLKPAQTAPVEEKQSETLKAPIAAAVSETGEPESSQEEVIKLPANVTKVSGLGVLGDKNLLQEMKIKQEKRFSRPLLSQEEDKVTQKPRDFDDGENKVAVEDSGVAAILKNSQTPRQPDTTPLKDKAGKKDLNDNTADQDDSVTSVKSTLATSDVSSSSSSSLKITSPPSNMSLPCKSSISPSLSPDISNVGMTSKSPPFPLETTHSSSALKTTEISPEVSHAGTSPRLPPHSPDVSHTIKAPEPTPDISSTDHSVKPLFPPPDIPQTATTPVALIPPGGSSKPSPAPLAKPPSLAPRTVPYHKRPVSSVDEGDSPPEIPPSMTTSTPELMLGGSLATKPRPTPPLKPRPPVHPRTKKGDSAGKDAGSEETEAASAPIKAAAAASLKPLTSAAEVDMVRELDEDNVELRPKSSAQDGVVTDSATLRLSVKDKIRRLSQAQSFSDTQGSKTAPKPKSVSLPRNVKLPINTATDLTENSQLDSQKEDMERPEETNFLISKEATLVSNGKENISDFNKQEDEILV